VRPVPRKVETLLSVRPDLVPTGSHVLVAFSGGPDSTALLHILSRLRESRDIRLTAAHFDHGLHPESRRIAERCELHCDRIGIPCHVGRVAGRIPFHHAAFRSARYAFLGSMAAGIGATRIATGHNADDQAETVVLRIARGTGIRGLRGIPVRRERIVRPLLNLRRREILAWLLENGISFENDPANADLRWSRSRIRHVVLPALERALGSDPVPSLLHLADRAATVERLTTLVAGSILDRARISEPASARETFAREAWLAEPAPLCAEAVRLWARRRGIRLGRGGTRSAVEFITRGRSGGYVLPGSRMRISRAFGALVFESEELETGLTGAGTSRNARETGHKSEVALRWSAELTESRGCSAVRIGGRPYRIEWRPGPGSQVPPAADRPNGSARVALTVHPAHYPLRLRAWEPGDRIRTRGGTRKLKKLFAEHRLSLEDRRSCPVLVDRAGRVVWVAGLSVAEWARSEPDHANLLIEIENA